jgi:hypothetical protein
MNAEDHLRADMVQTHSAKLQLGRLGQHIEGEIVMKENRKHLRGVVCGFAVAMLAMISPVAVHLGAASPVQAARSDSGVTAISPTKKSPTEPSTPPTPFAKPKITGPAKLPKEEQGLPGD